MIVQHQEYRMGRFRNSRIGTHAFLKMEIRIARFLNLPNPESYSGRSFKGSSATVAVDAGCNISAKKFRQRRVFETETSNTNNINREIKQYSKVGPTINANMPMLTFHNCKDRTINILT